MNRKAVLAILLIACVIFTACGNFTAQKPSEDLAAEQSSSQTDTKVSMVSQEALQSQSEASVTNLKWNQPLT